jgi:hypothetical protein
MTDVGELNEYGNELYLELDKNIHLKDTRRGFIKACEWGYPCHINEDNIGVLAINYKQAWSIIPEDFVNLSYKYHLDFKIYAFELGMEFNIDMEVINGKIEKFKEIAFDSYDWECINPLLGG